MLRLLDRVRFNMNAFFINLRYKRLVKKIAKMEIHRLDNLSKTIIKGGKGGYCI
jgi:hypothetical protein